MSLAMRHSSRQRGLTLVEVLVAMVVFGIMTASLGPLLVRQLRESRRGVFRNRVTIILTSHLDRYRFMKVEDLQSIAVAPPVENFGGGCSSRDTLTYAASSAVVVCVRVVQDSSAGGFWLGARGSIERSPYGDISMEVFSFTHGR